jgi:hypothetical protein
MGRNHLCEQAIPKDPAHLLFMACATNRLSGLSLGFPRLFPSRRQLGYVLLARPPRYSPCGFHVRLACLIHAANVRSEPGSNPSLGMFVLSVASPSPTNPKVHRQGGLPACPPGLPTQGHQALIKSSHAFFSRPPRMSKIASRAASPLRARGGRK